MDAEEVVGINMLTGAQEGHFGPTNRDNAIGVKKQNYLKMKGEKIQHPKFEREPTKKLPYFFLAKFIKL